MANETGIKALDEVASDPRVKSITRTARAQVVSWGAPDLIDVSLADGYAAYAPHFMPGSFSVPVQDGVQSVKRIMGTVACFYRTDD